MEKSTVAVAYCEEELKHGLPKEVFLELHGFQGLEKHWYLIISSLFFSVPQILQLGFKDTARWEGKMGLGKLACAPFGRWHLPSSFTANADSELVGQAVTALSQPMLEVSMNILPCCVTMRTTYLSYASLESGLNNFGCYLIFQNSQD